MFFLFMFSTYVIIAMACGFGLFSVGRKKAKYPLFMTFNEEQRKDEVLLALQKGYRIRAVGLTVFLLLIAGLTFFFGEMATLHLFFLVFWCAALFFATFRLNKKYATAAYNLKKERGWLRTSCANAAVLDTRVSALKKKMPVSAVWFIVPVWITIGSLFVWLLAYPKSKIAMVFVFCEIISMVLFIWLYKRVCHAKLKVYSENSEVNYAINCAKKRTVSGCMIWEATICNGYQLFMMVWLQKWLDVVVFEENWKQSLFWILFLSSMAVMTILTILPLVSMSRTTKKAQNILGEAEHTLLDEDEDSYWKNGYYYNPDCIKSDMVPSREGIGVTVNMASGWGKVTAWSLILSAALCLGIGLYSYPTEISGPSAKRTEQGITMWIGVFPKKQIRKDEVEKVEKIEKLPELSRLWGTETKMVAIGDYKAKGIGNCYAYLDKRADSFLLIQKTDGSYVIFSVKDAEDMEEFYRWLQ